jgi:hypothetical protein
VATERIGLTIESILPNTDASAGVVAVYDDDKGLGLCCHITRWGAEFPLVVNALQTEGMVSTRQPFELAANTPYLLRLRRDDGVFTCTAETGARVVTTPPLAAPPPATRLGLRASNVRIRYASRSATASDRS